MLLSMKSFCLVVASGGLSCIAALAKNASRLGGLRGTLGLLDFEGGEVPKSFSSASGLSIPGGVGTCLRLASSFGVNFHLKGESGGVGGRVKRSYWSSHSAILLVAEL